MIDVTNLDPERPLKDRELPIVEIFGDTLQGEGPRLRPAIFIRTGLCNFKCAGFGCTRTAPNGQVITGCDTIQAVSPKFKETWLHYNNFNDIINRVKPLYEGKNFKPDIIITGGEPTMHWDNKTFQQMLEFFINEGFHVTIESNGSRDVSFTKLYQTKVQFSLSVKLAVSGESKDKRFNPTAVNKILKSTNNSYLKFVVGPKTWEQDSKEIQEFLSMLDQKPQVFLMPLGETTTKQVENTRFVFEKCAEFGFNFSPRIHILAFNDLDGV